MKKQQSTTSTAVTTSDIDALLANAPARIREAIAGIVIGRSAKAVAAKQNIDDEAMERLMEIVHGLHFNAAINRFGVTLTRKHRDERAKNIATAASKNESIPSIAKRFQVSEVQCRNACRRHHVRLKLGRPRKPVG